MKFLHALAIILCLNSVSSASAMKCGGSVTKKETIETIDGVSYRRTKFYQEHHGKKFGNRLFIERTKNRKTGKTSYTGLIWDMSLNKKTGTFEVGPFSMAWLGDGVVKSNKKQLRFLYGILEEEYSKQNK